MMHIITEETKAADILPLRHMCSTLHHLLSEYANALKEGKQTQRNQRLQLPVFSYACSKTKPDLPAPTLLPGCAGGWPGSPLALHLPSSQQCLELVWETFFLPPVAKTTAWTVK